MNLVFAAHCNIVISSTPPTMHRVLRRSGLLPLATSVALSTSSALRWYTEQPSGSRFARRNSESPMRYPSQEGGRGGDLSRLPADRKPPSSQTGSTDDRVVLNRAGDSELSPLTCKSIRDDSRILFHVQRHIPKGGAISVKSLYSQLPPEVQEAVSEGFGGLKSFLEHRGQMFVLRTNPDDQVLYVTTTPLCQELSERRDLQKETLKIVMGIKKDPSERNGRGRGRGRGRGGRGQGGPRGRGRDFGYSRGRGGYGGARDGGRDFRRGREEHGQGGRDFRRDREEHGQGGRDFRRDRDEQRQGGRDYTHAHDGRDGTRDGSRFQRR